jgi:Flp pilus assembly protein TadD
VPAPLDAAVAARRSAHGLERAAAEYRLARVESSALSGADFQVELGLVRQRQGRGDEAVRHFREALAADPRHARAAQSLAMALHGLGQREQALAVYRRAVELDPRDAPTRANLGALLLDLNDVEGARAQLAALRELESELAPALEALIATRQERR